MARVFGGTNRLRKKGRSKTLPRDCDCPFEREKGERPGGKGEVSKTHRRKNYVRTEERIADKAAEQSPPVQANDAN